MIEMYLSIELVLKKGRERDRVDRQMNSQELFQGDEM